MSSAATLHCPTCGAAAASDADHCAYCRSRLAAVACPACFGMLFCGSRHCPHCGAAAAREAVDGGAPLPCPRCRAEMRGVRVGAAALQECPGCGGVWARREEFERIAAGTEEQAAVLGAARMAPVAAGGPEPVRYLPCPECAALMNRVNFARCSGVITDVCRDHGSWFDRDELRRVVEFIRGGGMSLAREREMLRLEEQRARLVRARMAAQPGGMAGMEDDTEEWTRALGAAATVLRAFLR
ncbi:MAG TPA: zf-TFIIB domain-containing protein [Longimicrobiaceae bacterium]|jgi:Zn-finger nucleic acid-binding protein